MQQSIQKTDAERASFIKRFALIIEKNVRVKDNYLISFADVNFLTEFYITDKGGEKLDLIGSLSTSEFSDYMKLLKAWAK